MKNKFVAVVCGILGFILLIMIIVNLPQIIWAELGFESPDKYYDTLFETEKKDLTAGIEHMFNGEKDELIDAAFQNQIEQIMDQINTTGSFANDG